MRAMHHLFCFCSIVIKRDHIVFDSNYYLEVVSVFFGVIDCFIRADADINAPADMFREVIVLMPITSPSVFSSTLPDIITSPEILVSIIAAVADEPAEA